jgi:hypothetical protein
MKTIRQVEIKPIFVEFIPDELKESEVYISREYSVSVHSCLCGCGEKVVLPLTNEGWKLIWNDNYKVSFTPSIGNYQLPCKSHYIITKNVANFV